MDRAQGLAAVRANVTNVNTVKHMLAVEAVMRALARRLGQDEEAWGQAGLLHDIDLEVTNADMETHSRVSADMARKLGASEAVCQAILVHNERHGIPRQTSFEKALWCADPVTGLVTAVALVMPDKKLASVQVSSISKRFKQLRFAAGANRDQIASCSELGLELDEFLSLGLEAMKGVAGELGM